MQTAVQGVHVRQVWRHVLSSTHQQVRAADLHAKVHQNGAGVDACRCAFIHVLAWRCMLQEGHARRHPLG